jgi:hypothetical protein
MVRNVLGVVVQDRAAQEDVALDLSLLAAVMDFLNYDSKPSYYFGVPKAGAGNPSSWIKVISIRDHEEHAGPYWRKFGFTVCAKQITLAFAFRHRPLRSRLMDTINCELGQEAAEDHHEHAGQERRRRAARGI